MSREKFNTNFLEKQAKENAKTGTARGVITVIALLIFGALGYGAYSLITALQANPHLRNTTIVLRSPVLKNGKAIVAVDVHNVNAFDIENPTFKYTITAAGDKELAAGQRSIKGSVPAGDVRSFTEVDLGPVSGKPKSMHADLVDLTAKGDKALSNSVKAQFTDALEHEGAERVSKLQALAATSDFDAIHVALGLAAEKMEQWQDAIVEYRKAIALNDANYNAHYHLGLALLHEKKATEGMAELKKAAELNPNDETVTKSIKTYGPGGVAGASSSSSSPGAEASQASASE
jgi:tetratricopeptide (TPR) repeat protein